MNSVLRIRKKNALLIKITFLLAILFVSLGCFQAFADDEDKDEKEIIPELQNFYTWPLPEEGTITAKWYYDDEETDYHGAVDICLPEGTSVLAAADGIVKYVQTVEEDENAEKNTEENAEDNSEDNTEEKKTYSRGTMEAYGNMCVVYHPANGTATLYAHMKEVRVSEGQTVSRGEELGTLGQSGNTTGPHLHFELLKGATAENGYSGVGERVDPLDYLSSDMIYDPTHNPRGGVDGVEGGHGIIHMVGWAYDPDDSNASIQLKIYIGKDKDPAALYVVNADKERPDVNTALGIVGAHGFDVILSVNPTNKERVYIYATNVGDGRDVRIGSGAVSVLPDTEAPVISHITVSDISASGYTLTCDATDDGAIKGAVLTTWTLSNGKDDIEQIEGTVANGKAVFRVENSRHDNQIKGIFVNEIAVFDYAGRSSSKTVMGSYIADNIASSSVVVLQQ